MAVSMGTLRAWPGPARRAAGRAGTSAAAAGPSRCSSTPVSDPLTGKPILPDRVHPRRGPGAEDPHAAARPGRRAAQPADEGDARRSAGRVAAHARGRGDHARRLSRLRPADDRAGSRRRCRWRRSPRRCWRSSTPSCAAAGTAAATASRPSTTAPLPSTSAGWCGTGAGPAARGPRPHDCAAAGCACRRVPAARLHADVGVVDPAGALDHQCRARRRGAMGVDPVEPGRHRQEAEAAGPAAGAAERVPRLRGSSLPRGSRTTTGGRWSGWSW